MKRVIIFLCLFFSLFAQADLPQQLPPPEPEPVEKEPSSLARNYWKFHHAAYLGYRRDRQQFNSYGPGLLDNRMKMKNWNSIQVMASSHAEFSNIVGYVRASYAWLVSAHTDFRVPGYGPPLSFPNFNMGAGYAVDTRAALAYRIKVYDRPSFGFSLMPGFGYRYASMMSFNQGEKRYPLPGTNNFAICRLPNPNHQDWFGPFADARVEFRFSDFCEWLLSCQYHQPYLVSKSKNQVEVYTFSGGGALTSDQLSTTNSVVKAPASHMLLGMSDLKFHFGSGWTYGFNFEGASTWAKKGSNHSVLKQETFGGETIVSKANSRATLQWTFYFASFMVGHTF